MVRRGHCFLAEAAAEAAAGAAGFAAAKGVVAAGEAAAEGGLGAPGAPPCGLGACETSLRRAARAKAGVTGHGRAALRG